MMSNYYLCDACEHWRKWRPNYTGLEGRCTITEESGSLFLKKDMADHRGEGGKRYDEPTDVCKGFVRRIEATDE